jgi:phage I-like protein
VNREQSGMSERLLCLRVHSPQFDPASGELPKRLLILPWGANTTTQGPVVCNETTAALLLSNNEARGYDRPVLDWEHSSEPKSPTYRGEPAKIAGHGTLEVVPGEGVYLLMAHWTPEGAESAKGGHYPDLSPVVFVNEKDEVVALKSVALCRHGATSGLRFLSVETPPQHEATPKTAAKPQTLRPSRSALRLHLLSTMTKPPATADEFLATLRAMMNMPAEATPEEVYAGLEKMLSAKVDASQGEDVKALSATINKLEGLITAQGESLKLLSASHVEGQREMMLSAAAREGKVINKDFAAKLDLEQLRMLCATTPVTVPVQIETPEGVKLLSADGTKIDPPELKAIDQMMGVSEEDRKKYL